MQKVPIISNHGTNISSHVTVLDGWRGLSILCVLAAHLLPLGPKSWQFNESVGIVGMALFFILSGFLITSSLIKNQSITRFLLHRFCRVAPLAWLYLLIALGISHVSFDIWISHFLFYANLPPVELTPLTAHIWSLCVEVQFYVGVAVIIFILGVRGLQLLPLLAFLFTALRMWFGVTASSITYFRIDEILAGCILALVFHEQILLGSKALIRSIPLIVILPLFMLSCLPQGQWLNFFRPYLAALLIGVTILNRSNWLISVLNHRIFIYCAAISYSFYVIHPLLAASWLGSGDVIIKVDNKQALAKSQKSLMLV